MNELAEHEAPDGAVGAEKQGSEPKSRPIYDKSASEATRELRDTSRRRRDAEVKLQQHLMEAREHVPHHHDGETQAPEKHPLDEPQEKDPEAAAG